MAVTVERDVIIVGAGPAGAICAAYMARAGLDVLLIDKDLFPRDKVCGDMLKEGIVKHIEKLEAVDVLDEKSTCIRKLRLIGGAGHEAEVPFECYSLTRTELDKLLTDTAVSWGVEFRQGCRLIDVINEDGKVRGVVVREKGAEYQIRSRVVIGADGANSYMAKQLGIVEEKPEGIWLGVRAYFKGVIFDKSLAKSQYDAGGIFCFDDKQGPAYFWIMPVGANGVKDGLCNVGLLLRGRDDYSDTDMIDRLREWTQNNDKVHNMMDGAQQLCSWSFGRLADNSQNRKCVGNGYILIGDAAAKVPPLFNDGLTAAADTAKAAADAVEAALKTGEVSEDYLHEKYEQSLSKLRSEKSEDEVKLEKLLIESLGDPEVIDKIIEKLDRDPNYRKNIHL